MIELPPGTQLKTSRQPELDITYAIDTDRAFVKVVDGDAIDAWGELLVIDPSRFAITVRMVITGDASKIRQTWYLTHRTEIEHRAIREAADARRQATELTDQLHRCTRRNDELKTRLDTSEAIIFYFAPGWTLLAARIASAAPASTRETG